MPAMSPSLYDSPRQALSHSAPQSLSEHSWSIPDSPSFAQRSDMVPVKQESDWDVGFDGTYGDARFSAGNQGDYGRSLARSPDRRSQSPRYISRYHSLQQPYLGSSNLLSPTTSTHQLPDHSPSQLRGWHHEAARLETFSSDYRGQSASEVLLPPISDIQVPVATPAFGLYHPVNNAIGQGVRNYPVASQNVLTANHARRTRDPKFQCNICHDWFTTKYALQRKCRSTSDSVVSKFTVPICRSSKVAQGGSLG
jgi:hypothetical protein